MSSIIGRTAFRASAPLRSQTCSAFRPTQRLRAVGGDVTSASDREAGKEALKTGAKRDPELISLFVVMCGAFGLAGWHFSRSPTTANSEKSVSKIPGSEPWAEGGEGGEGKYQYHPQGDKSQRKDAPSALNVTIIPNVNLPKSLHDQYNKYGKEGY